VHWNAGWWTGYKNRSRNGSMSVFSIAVITLVNGADNIGVYMPVCFCQPVAPVVGSVYLWPVGPRVVCRREMDWKPPSYSEGG